MGLHWVIPSLTHVSYCCCFWDHKSPGFPDSGQKVPSRQETPRRWICWRCWRRRGWWWWTRWLRWTATWKLVLRRCAWPPEALLQEYLSSKSNFLFSSCCKSISFVPLFVCKLAGKPWSAEIQLKHEIWITLFKNQRFLFSFPFPNFTFLIFLPCFIKG